MNKRMKEGMEETKLKKEVMNKQTNEGASEMKKGTQ